MAKVQFGYTWTPAMVEAYLQSLNFAQFGLVHRMKDNYLWTREMPEDPEEIAFFFNVDVAQIEALWDRRTQIAWTHVKQYMDVIFAERDEFVEEKTLAGIRSGEARKDSVSLEEAEEILGALLPVYEAFATHWSHKKVTSEDCEKVKALIDTGKATQEQMISAIARTAKNTPADKIQYMKGVGTWLSSGGWMGRDNARKGKLDQCNDDSRDSLIARMSGGAK
jgi:hypothetical protein